GRDPARVAASAGSGPVTGAALAAAVLRALGRRRRRRSGARDGDSVPVDPMAGTGELDHPSPRPAALVAARGKTVGDATGELKTWVARVDRFQRSHTWTAFPYAVVKKFGDDEAGDLA